MVSRKKIGMLLLLGLVIATTMVLALNVTAHAQDYGAVSGGGTGATGSGTPATGAEVVLLALAGAGMIGAGYFLTRKAKA